jgi:hypothetical protein
MAEENQTNNKKSAYTVVLYVPQVKKDNKTMELRAILLSPKGAPVAGKEILFHVDKQLQAGSHVTDEHGNANYSWEIPDGTTTVVVRATAAVEGKPSSGDSVVNLAKASAPKESLVHRVEVFTEQVKHRDGSFSYRLSVLNMTTSKPIAEQIYFNPSRAVLFNGRLVEDGFLMSVPEEGLSLKLRTDEPGRIEIDLIPVHFPKDFKQIEVYGPTRVPIKATPDSPVLVRLFDGCE